MADDPDGFSLPRPSARSQAPALAPIHHVARPELPWFHLISVAFHSSLDSRLSRDSSSSDPAAVNRRWQQLCRDRGLSAGIVTTTAAITTTSTAAITTTSTTAIATTSTPATAAITTTSTPATTAATSTPATGARRPRGRPRKSLATPTPTIQQPPDISAHPPSPSITPSSNESRRKQLAPRLARPSLSFFFTTLPKPRPPPSAPTPSLLRLSSSFFFPPSSSSSSHSFSPRRTRPRRRLPSDKLVMLCMRARVRRSTRVRDGRQPPTTLLPAGPWLHRNLRIMHRRTVAVRGKRKLPGNAQEEETTENTQEQSTNKSGDTRHDNGADSAAGAAATTATAKKRRQE